MKQKDKEKAIEIVPTGKITEQSNLFGDQDFVYNVIHAQITGVREDIEKTRESINRKEQKIEALDAQLGELEKAAKIIAEQKKAMEKSRGKQG